MPLYFFDVITDRDQHRDAIGIELRDDEEARCEAVSVMLAIVEEIEVSGGSAAVTINARNAASDGVVQARCEISVRYVSDLEGTADRR